MATSRSWRLKRYGRFVPGSMEKGGKPWKVFEANGNKPEIVLTIMESGYLLVLQGQESLPTLAQQSAILILGRPIRVADNQARKSPQQIMDTVPLLCGSDCLKIHHKSDNLMFRFSVEGESRMVRMQFAGSSRAHAIKECSSAVEKLMEYMPVASQDDAPLPSNQSPTEFTAPEIQTCHGKAVGVEPEVVQGSLSIKRLTQHFLGEAAVTLPQVYHHGSLAQGDLEPILRICLLDPSFHAFVEKVEGELRKLLQE